MKLKVPEFMPFGKYKGERISDVPTSYIEWALSEWNFETNPLLMTELANQLVLRRGEGVVRKDDYVKDHENK